MSQYTGITSDSREVKPGYIFVAVRGTTQDGHLFLKKADDAGAALLIGEETRSDLKAPYIQVTNSRKELALRAAEFYGHPSRNMLALGVTGTSGKTTLTYLLESIFKAAGKKVGVIGTVNFRFGEKIYPSTHTTPGPVELQKLLREMADDGCDALVMEVSSHALKQSRAHGIEFKGAVFTNLSPEHLDFHPDIEDYFQSKKILFTELLKGPSAVNVVDLFGKRLADELGNARPYGYETLQLSLAGIDGEIEGVKIRSKLIGQFNAENIAGAVQLAIGLGISKNQIAKGVTDLEAVPGRLQNVGTEEITVLVDYAHKSDALEKVLKTLQGIAKKRIITVFGCGGDRDRTKRPRMGKIAVERSNTVIITSDNPRTEDPLAIIEEIKAGVQGFSNFSIEPDRRKAIFSAIQLAQPGDVVLIAGKGHEDYQIIGDGSGTKKVHFDDREVAREALALRKKS